MSNESESDVEKMEARAEEVNMTTTVMMTPEDDLELGVKGTFWLYSVGMWDNHNLPDLELRGIPGSFVKSAGSVINEMNAYRLAFPDKPFLTGQSISWHTGDFVIHPGETWDGAYSWTPETMLRLRSRLEDVPHCDSCDCCGEA